ncbi:MAG: tRNA lysidine(34) synthetase TilS [Clostridia bacterium]|nr:tRNA lysidine(34) synthetase TilS [Clostridia bacterium]
MILDKALDFIKKNELIKYGDKILVGLSGGADSVCLTHILYTLGERMGLTLYTAHLNHGIRGAEAERDEMFAEEFSRQLGIECFVKHADVKSCARLTGESEELCGRRLRYEFFDELCEKHGIDKIATAHNKNDNAETILMNFIRGSSLAGLCGIPVRRDNIIRPVLCLTRDEITEYIDKNNLKYVTDSTNLEEVYTRNKIRRRLMPEIESDFNPNFISAVVRNSENLQKDRELLDTLANEAYEKCGNDIELLGKQHISVRRRIIYKMLDECIADMSSVYVDAVDSLIMSGKTGSRIALPRGFEAAVSYGRLLIRKSEAEQGDFEYKLTVDAETEIKELGICVKPVRTDSGGPLAFSVPDGAELAIRNRRAGDCFFPEGMNGRKKLKKFFIDEKTEREKRSKTGIFTVDGEIAYVMGMRRDRRFKFCGGGIRLEITEIGGAAK